jgi:hypothetical protein
MLWRDGKRGKTPRVTADARDQRRTSEAMYDTSAALERSEAALHESAEKSPDEATARRLHDLADGVTREAQDIERRADAINHEQ